MMRYPAPLAATVRRLRAGQDDLMATIDEMCDRIEAVDPGLVNRDCYGEGWLVRIRPSDASRYDALLTPAQYGEIAGE